MLLWKYATSGCKGGKEKYTNQNEHGATVWFFLILTL